MMVYGNALHLKYAGACPYLCKCKVHPSAEYPCKSFSHELPPYLVNLGDEVFQALFDFPLLILFVKLSALS